jgi:hypothetical protein
VAISPFRLDKKLRDYGTLRRGGLLTITFSTNLQAKI